MTRNATNHILDLIDQDLVDSQLFLESLFKSLSEHEVRENLEYIARIEDWPKELRFEE
jgi:hypothetical protein